MGDSPWAAVGEGARVTDKEPRCWRCNRVLAHLATRPWSIDCHRCHAQNKSEPIDKVVEIK